jgi:hypothetical protein
VASATIWWRLLVERVASLSCAASHEASCPRPAVTTISGLLPKSTSEAASCVAVDPSKNSLMKLFDGVGG